MADITATYEYDASPEEVFDALVKEEKLRKWWCQDCHATPKRGSIARFVFKPYGDTVMLKFETVKKPAHLVWKCIDSTMGNSDEWTGTTIDVQLEEKDGKTIMRFAHSGWKEETDLFRKCTEGWDHFINQSLNKFLKEGQGTPA